MRIIIASDIHGNLEYTKKLYDYCEKINPDKIILLGDLLNNYYVSDYFEENEIVSIMNRWSAITIAVRGNSDREDDLAKLNFPVSTLYEKINLDGTMFYLTHGHLYNKYNFLFGDNYVLMGHTHKYNLEGKQINPGSVGMPRVNKEHTCLYYENHTFTLIDLDKFKTIQVKEI